VVKVGIEVGTGAAVCWEDDVNVNVLRLCRV